MSGAQHSQVAKRYAEALFTTLDAADHSRISQELKGAITVLEDPVVRDVFRHPKTTRERKSVLIRLMELSPIMETFLLLIVEKSREGLLPSMEYHFEQLVLKAQRTTIADVISAIPLSDETLRALTQKLELLTGKTIRLETQLDPRIGGGMIIKIDGKVIDGSISHTLRQFQRTLVP